MILSCPACAVQFVIDPRALGAGGRKVRCGKCRHEWQATAPLITLPADIQPPAENLKVKPVPAGSALPAMAAAVASNIPFWRSAGLAAAAAFFLVLPFFALKIGPYFSGHGPAEKAEAVALEGTPSTLLREEEGRPVLVVEGVLVNRSGSVQKVPVLQASALNARGEVVKEWAIPLSAAQLEAGQRLPFSFSAPLSEQGVEDIAFHLL